MPTPIEEARAAARERFSRENFNNNGGVLQSRVTTGLPIFSAQFHQQALELAAAKLGVQPDRTLSPELKESLSNFNPTPFGTPPPFQPLAPPPGIGPSAAATPGAGEAGVSPQGTSLSLQQPASGLRLGSNSPPQTRRPPSGRGLADFLRRQTSVLRG